MEAKKERELPPSEFIAEIGANSYTIKFPIKTGTLIDIESMKITSTGGAHKDMQFGNSSAQQAWVLTEAISTFTFLIPELRKDLTVPSLYDLDQMQSKSMLKAYRKFAVWYGKWQEVVNEDLNDEE